MLVFVLKLAGYYAAFTLTWSIFKRLFVGSPLDNLPGPPSKSWISGNFSDAFSIDSWNFHYDLLKRFPRVVKITGMLGDKILYISDPKALDHILVKDAHIYDSSLTIIARNYMMFGSGLVSSLGQQHRKQRKIITPVFSMQHIRELIPVFYEASGQLRETLISKVKSGQDIIDINSWMKRTALEVIGRGGLGYSFESLKDDQSHPYGKIVGQMMMLLSGPMGFIANRYVFHIAYRFNFPRIKKFLGSCVPLERARGLRRLIDMSHRTAHEIIESKKNMLKSDGPDSLDKKKDIISILMAANVNADVNERLDDGELYAQVATLVFAAMDTTSSALSRTLELLAQNQHVQDRLRQEIMEAQYNGQLSYEDLEGLPYLDAVCRETLRRYPPVMFSIMRTPSKDAILPLSKPIKGANGKDITEFIVPKGTDILLSILGANIDPDLWGEDSHEWKPERWLNPLPETLLDAKLPGVSAPLMTFLGGGRSCIGFKFAQLEMKVILSTLLSTFKIDVSPKDKISWKTVGIVGPYIETPDGIRPGLPMKFDLLNPLYDD